MHVGNSRSRRTSRRRIACAAVFAATLFAACSGGSDDDVTESSDATTVGASTPDFVATETTDFVPDDDTVVGTVVLDDDVIIATEDGAIPATSTDPPVEDTPDALLPEDAVTTTAAPVPLPDPASVGRIVSLSATHTETLFALGLGDFVVAVDGESDFPAETASLRRNDISAESADLTTLLALEPDVVVLGDDPTSMANRLAAVGVASYSGSQPATLEGVFTQIMDIAAIVGRPDLGEDLAASMRAEIASIVQSIPPFEGDKTFFHEIDPTLVTLTSDGFLSDVYGTVGLTNIAGDAGGAPFGQISNDAVIAANPDVILLADAECCRVTIDVVSARPGWEPLSAVNNGAVVLMSDDLIMRWGPRVVELIRQVAGALAASV